MKEKKKINISVLLMLLAIIIFIGVSYAAFVFITNSGIIEANSGKLDIAYNIENSSVNGTLIPSSTRSGGISTSVTAKLNSGSIPGNINLYITPTALTGMPFSALMWEVDVVDTSDNLLTHYEGDFTGCVINTPVKITDAYSLTTNLLTFKIYIWLNGERINNENYNSNNGFTATISADSISITGEFDPTYTVTFDADGGIGASGTKSVRVGEDYGLLPTPTKEGYTFLGWNGKNKFNINTIARNMELSSMAGTIYASEGKWASDYIEVEGNKEYTSLNISSSTKCWYDNNKTFISATYSATATSPSNAKYLKVNGTIDSIDNNSNVQIEEGTEATAYEPYYVTSDVNVTQAKNHTLKAIWEPNTYTVTLDADGGTIPSTSGWTGSGSSATKQVVYGSEYGALPTPTKEGYTFKGWNGKNKFFIFDFSRGAYMSNENVVFDASNIEENKGYGFVFQKYYNNMYVTGSNEIVIDNVIFTKDSSFDYVTLKINTSLYDPHIYFGNNLINGETYTFSYNIVSSNFVQAQATLSNLQLEEGSTATAYEPYYVTSDVNVTQAKNHNLTAIWEANS